MTTPTTTPPPDWCAPHDTLDDVIDDIWSTSDDEEGDD